MSSHLIGQLLFGPARNPARGLRGGATAPRVISVSPANGATNVDVNTDVTINFSEVVTGVAFETFFLSPESSYPRGLQTGGDEAILMVPPLAPVEAAGVDRLGVGVLAVGGKPIRLGHLADASTDSTLLASKGLEGPPELVLHPTER